MISKIQITITLLLLFIAGSCVLAKTTPATHKEVPGMVFIKGGTYEMGLKNYTETVTVGDFYIGKYEVTNKEYCEYDPVHKGEWSDSDYPVESVSWNDAVGYCKWLSNKTGKNYRLPTEAEWEYACRAGSTTDYYWGNTIDGSYCWYSDNSGDQVHTAGQKHPNAWWLYDMAGNVMEWCSDRYDNSNSYRIERGGCWGGCCVCCRSGYRDKDKPDYRGYGVGFRIVMEP
jgi:formylglycine-generating enzyme required for sulfatase activity